MLERAALLLGLGLGGCYAEFGLGNSGQSYATAHASIGIAAHFGERGAVRVGAGAAIGAYEPAAAETGSTFPGPVVVGGHARIVGGNDALVLTGDVHAPWGGRLSIHAPQTSETAHATRAFVGLGYRHSWRAVVPVNGEDGEDGEQLPPPEEEGSIAIALGPELFHGASTNSARPTDTQVGVAFSVTFGFRAGALWRGLEKLGSDEDD